ncbi:DUF4148 domain-containing protein [Piscinibacter sakaiensis]|uniref:DUF4148 domain-containing protein n=1 Tax=Piscinibacter sakaiensis TaxID=1547922 RepID=UPI003AB076F8
MNAKTLIAAISLTLAAAPGFAGDMTGGGHKMSRVEVQADVMPAGDAWLSRGEAYGTVVPVSTRSRASVLAELDAARADGLIVAGSESHGLFRDRDLISTEKRSNVMARTPDATHRANLYNGA